MSKAMRERRLMAPPVGVLTIALLLVVALAGSRFGQTRAQDASPVAGSDCVSASADAASMDEGTPEAAPAATPVDATGAEAAIAAANAYVECYNASGAELQISDLTTDAESAATYDDGHTSIGVTYMLGEYQYVAATWFFHTDGTDLMFAEEDLGGIAPEGDTVIKSASVADGATSVSFGQGGNVTESEVITIHIINVTGTEAAHYDLYAIPAAEGAATPVAGEEMATPTSDEAMASGELVGSLVVPAGGEEDMYLIGLPVGTYALVDANVAGSVATLTVASLGI
jgi:hypothetical protein